MEKIYQICFHYGNELDDIRMATTLEAAIRLLTENKRILEFEVVNGVANENPNAVYYYEEGKLIKHIH